MAISDVNSFFHYNKDFIENYMNKNILEVVISPSDPMRNLDFVQHAKSRFNLPFVVMYDDKSYDDNKKPKKVERNNAYWFLNSYDKDEFF